MTALTAVGDRYHTLRGLFALPTGLVFLGAGVFNTPPLGDEPVDSGAPWFLATVAVAALGYYAVNRYYLTVFGRVQPSRRTVLRAALYTVGCAAAIALALSLDLQRDWPVTLYGAAYAGALLAYYRLLDALRPHHLILLGGFALLCLAPVWGQVDDRVSTALIPMGLVTMAVGLLDHRDLLRSLRAARLEATGEVPGAAR
ncbi:MAG: hypothetical protein WB441_07945 [Nocardioidaceae bacterium]